ncbi:MAG: hypothetical protein AAGJ18_14705 [Bacteroidota bacterium]
MKKVLLFSFLALCFTSCFEIVEQIDVKNDGTGKMLVTLDMSESKEDLKGYMESGEVGNMSLPSQTELNNYLGRIEKTIESVEGMSDATAKGDFNEFIFTFEANFADVQSMNKAVNKLTKELSRGMLSLNIKYEYVNGQFTRSFGNIIAPEDYEKLPVIQRFVLESARMASVYTFSQPVKKMTNANAKLSSNKKTVEFKSTLGDIAKGTKAVKNTISF